MCSHRRATCPTGGARCSSSTTCGRGGTLPSTCSLKRQSVPGVQGAAATVKERVAAEAETRHGGQGAVAVVGAVASLREEEDEERRRRRYSMPRRQVEGVAGKGGRLLWNEKVSEKAFRYTRKANSC